MTHQFLFAKFNSLSHESSVIFVDIVLLINFFHLLLVGDGTQVNRGCVATQEDDDQTCLTANSGDTPVSCSLCSDNECNNGNSSNKATKYTEISLLVVLSSLLVALAIR